MGEILGIGTTHYPGLAADDEGLCSLWKYLINAPLIDRKWQDRANWPAGMVEEVGNDEGLSAAARYRERMWGNFRKQRAMIDAFEPDFIVVIADDQYENFKEDIIPPFCVYGLDDDFEQEVWAHGIMGKRPNHWGEPVDTKITFHGHREGAKCIATGMLERGIPMPYAYKMLHSPTLAHGFNYTQLYLDLDRTGFFELQRDGNHRPFYKRLFQPHEHQVIAAAFKGVHFIRSDGHAAFDLAHAHDAIIVRTVRMQLDLIGHVGRRTDQTVIRTGVVHHHHKCRTGGRFRGRAADVRVIHHDTFGSEGGRKEKQCANGAGQQSRCHWYILSSYSKCL